MKHSNAISKTVFPGATGLKHFRISVPALLTIRRSLISAKESVLDEQDSFLSQREARDVLNPAGRPAFPREANGSYQTEAPVYAVLESRNRATG